MSHSYAQEECLEARLKQKSALLCRTACPAPENDLSIAEVRKALSCLRKGWEAVQLDRTSKPLYLSSVLSLSQSQRIRMEDFALRFVLAHHQKRHSGSGASENNGR